MGALPPVNDPHAEGIWAFVSRSSSAYTLVVSIETCPSHVRIVLMSTPARSKCASQNRGGVHYVNPTLFAGGELDASGPQG